MPPASTVRRNWPEYLIEGWALGIFMISAAIFTVLLEHPESPLHALVPSGVIRRAWIGLAMGLTAVALIYSPWGQRSGAHMNPAVTLAFLRLGRIRPGDAAGYIVAQFIGGLTGIWIARQALGRVLDHPAVGYVTTVPGPRGAGVAFVAETLISFGMMWMVLTVTNTPKLARFTGLFAGILVFVYITVEAPLSGMSINPARTFASALPSGVWTGGWIYFTAPLLGMCLAAEARRRRRAPGSDACPKLCHGTHARCIFCGQGATAGTGRAMNLQPMN